MSPRHPLKLKLSLPGRLAPEQRPVAIALVGVATLTGLWSVFWRIPTEVVGKGVFAVAEGASMIDARADGQIRQLLIRPGDHVHRGQTLMHLYQPVQEKELQRLQQNLAELVAQDRRLTADEQRRLVDKQREVTAGLADLDRDEGDLRQLQRLFQTKTLALRQLVDEDVVAPLNREVVLIDERLLEVRGQLAEFPYRRRTLRTQLAQVEEEIAGLRLQRRREIDDLARQTRVAQARLAFDRNLRADRDGVILDLQVISGQFVRAGQRLGTLGQDQQRAPMTAVAYFPPGDARRLRLGMSTEIVPDWGERPRFGGIVGRVEHVATLPATAEDIQRTIGNPDLAQALVKGGPVVRTSLTLERDPQSRDGYRWTLSEGSPLFPIRDGLTLSTHAYVEWRSPLSYLLPGLRQLTGVYRSLPGEDPS
jgi:HlyD family secretion protein